jgi:hypothetical protein
MCDIPDGCGNERKGPSGFIVKTKKKTAIVQDIELLREPGLNSDLGIM